MTMGHHQGRKDMTVTRGHAVNVMGIKPFAVQAVIEERFIRV
jgi:hypothetical protein